MSSMVKSSLWIFFCSFFIRIFSFISNPIMARNYPKADIAEFRSLQALILLVFTLIPIGSNLLYLAEKKEFRSKYWNQFISFSVIGSVISIIVLLFISGGMYQKVPMLNLIVILIPLTLILKNIYTTKLTEKIDFKKISLAQMIHHTLNNILIIVGAYTLKSIEILIASLIFTEILEIVVLAVYTKKYTVKLNNNKLIIFDRKTQNFTFFVGLSTIIVNFALQLPTILAVNLMGSELAVEFQMPLILIGVPVVMIVQAVSKVFLPLFSNNPENEFIQQKIFITQYIYWFVGFSIMYFVWWFAKDITYLVINPEWKNSILALKFFSIFMFINILQNSLSQIALIKNKPSVQFYYSIFLLIGRIISLYIGFKHYGFYGSVIAFTITDSVVRLARLIIDLHLIDVKLVDYLRYVKIPILYCITLISLSYLLASINIKEYMSFIIAILLSIFIYAFIDRKKLSELYKSFVKGFAKNG